MGRVVGLRRQAAVMKNTVCAELGSNPAIINASMDDTPFPILSADAMPAATSGPSSLPPAEPVGALPVALRDALALSMELSSQVINNLVGRALLSLDRQSTANKDDQEKALLDASALELDKQRGRWLQQYPALLRIACAHPSAAARAATANADLRICAADLQQIDELVKAAGGKRNPLAAKSHVQALMELISRSQAHPALRQVWADQLQAALGSQLAWVSLQLIATLKNPTSRETPTLVLESGFEAWAASAYGFTDDAAQGDDANHADVEFTPEMRKLASDARHTVLRLRKALGESGTQPGQLEAASALSPMNRMLRDLDEAERMMALMQERGLQLPNEDDEEQGAVAQVTEQAAQNFAEQISELIKSYQNTTSPSLARVPPPLREALELLQSPLEKLAVLDASLLSNGNHAARALLDGMTQRSLQFSTEMSEGFSSFIGPVNKVIQALSNVPQPSARMFTQALSSLQALWLRQDAEKQTMIERKAQEQAMVEQRKQLAGRLAFELVSRKDAGDAPVQIKQLLMGSWAQVLARAQLYPQYPQDQAYFGQVTAALLWSVSQRRAGVRKTQLQTLLPSLQAALQEGLASVDLHPTQIEEAMKDLAKLHADVLAADTPADQGSPAGDNAPVIPPRA